MQKLTINELQEISGGSGCDLAMLFTSTAASAGYGAAFGTAFDGPAGAIAGAIVGAACPK